MIENLMCIPCVQGIYRIFIFVIQVYWDKIVLTSDSTVCIQIYGLTMFQDAGASQVIHTITEYCEVEGTNKYHQSPTPGLAQETHTHVFDSIIQMLPEHC